MTTPLSKIAALFVLNRWYQNEAVRARDACARPEKVWRRCVAGACRLKSPMENNACFPLSTKVARGRSRVNEPDEQDKSERRVIDKHFEDFANKKKQHDGGLNE